VVTGAGQGVGREIAIQLAAHGAGTVIVNDLFADRADAVVEEIRRAGGSAQALVADVTDPAAVAALAAAAAEVGPIQIVVNNAGLPPGDFDMRPFLDSSPEAWEPLIRLNLYGVLHVTHRFLGPMVEAGWGRIITVVSDSARSGDAYQAVYAAAKAGAAGFMRSIATEVGPFGVTANCISLGSLARGFDPTAAMTEEQARPFRFYPLRRPGRPADVAPMAVFLASNAASWITGQVYSVNGGYRYGL
jgi:2-hydroxycyclohexanecarboxyl-CoA dehydrogenase